MIRLFDIKRKVKQLKNTDKELFESYKLISTKDKNEILKEYNTTDDSGLNSKQVEELLEKNGQNVVVKRENKGPLSFLVKSFNGKFIYLGCLLIKIRFLLIHPPFIKLTSSIIIYLSTAFIS